ncbi:MAG: glycoside hydrolase family 3 protein, partial [Chloroflexota bacterium]
MNKTLIWMILLMISLHAIPLNAQDVRTPTDGRAQYRDEASLIVAGMSLEEKVGQMFLVGLYGPIITDEGRQFLQTYKPGGVVLFNYNVSTPESVTALINDWQTAITGATGMPLIVAIDQEGGRINTLEDVPFTQFPVPALVTATGNHNLAYRVGAAQSLELRAVGIHMNLAPVTDLETNPENPVIFRRSYGSDPFVVAPTISATVQGMQDVGMMATLKHFPGHGDTSDDSHVTLPVLPYDFGAIQSLELIPFQSGIEAGVEAVMVGHLWLPAIDPEPNRPASLSPIVVTDILRDYMGFDGIIMTDAMDMDAIDTYYGSTEAAVMAVEAGVDLITTGPHMGLRTTEASIEAVVQAVREGRIPQASIDASASRIVSSKLRYGVLDWQPLDPATTMQRVENANAQAIVQELFSSGVTLVYDHEQRLPFDTQSNVLVAYPSHRQTVMRSCGAVGPQVRLYGFSNFPTIGEIDTLEQAAQTVDHVIVFTQNAVDKPEQAALVNALPAEKTVVVAYWSPYDLNVFDRRPAAYMATYSPHDEGIAVACNVLFGQQNA